MESCTAQCRRRNRALERENSAPRSTTRSLIISLIASQSSGANVRRGAATRARSIRVRVDRRHRRQILPPLLAQSQPLSQTHPTAVGEFRFVTQGFVARSSRALRLRESVHLRLTTDGRFNGSGSCAVNWWVTTIRRSPRGPGGRGRAVLPRESLRWDPPRTKPKKKKTGWIVSLLDELTSSSRCLRLALSPLSSGRTGSFRPLI